MRYAYVQQHDATDCAAACMAMICLYYKKETTIARLRDMMGTDLKGTNLTGLTDCAEQLGFMTQAVRVDRQAFGSKFTLPAVAHVITEDGYLHFVVIFKIEKNYVIVGDPAKELRRIPIERFYRRFTGVLLILAPTNDFVPGKLKSKSVLKRYVNLMMPQKKLFLYAMLASLILMILGIASSKLNHVIYDDVLPNQSETILKMVLVISFIVSSTTIGLSFIKKWILMKLSMKIDIPLMLGYFKHIYRLPMRFFATRKVGDIITRYSDACTIRDVLSGIALSLVMDVTMAVLSGVILFQMNAGLFGIIVLMTICSMVLVYVFKKPYKRINMEQMHRNSTMNSEIIEGLRAIETIKGNADEDRTLEAIEREYLKCIKTGYKEGMLSNIQGAVSGAITTLGNLALLYVGLSQVISGELTLGAYVAFSTLSGYFMNPVSNLVGLQLSIQEADLSMKRLAEIMDYETEKDEREINVLYREEDEIEGDVVFRDVTFRYGKRRPALSHLSFTVHEGQKVAIVGASGSGKSTIAKLLLRFYEPESGEITIGGRDIRSMQNYSLREGISYIPQNIELFSKTIYDNIRMSKSDATEKEVERAAELAGAQEFIDKLPMQYNTYLEEAGNGLSGGEKQRLAIARALLKDTQLYIMDEGTSSLDFMTENAIFDMIYNRLKDRTMLIIAHRLATIRHCDQIIVMDHGEIVEQGKHEELLAKHGRYYELWNMQQGCIS